jgi:hypothetical protein
MRLMWKYMKERQKLILLLLVPAIFFMAMTSLQLTHFSVLPNPANEAEVNLEWSVDDLSKVSKFEIYRKIPSRGNNYEPIYELVVTSSIRQNPPSRFTHRDNTLYKATTVADEAYYILRVIDMRGTRIYESSEERVQYTTSATRRTWGSIKSMFQ